MTASEAVTDALRDLHARYAGVREGRRADYIPELARSDPDAFGIAVVSMDGHCYSAGAADTAFTLQSVSKPFVYALALSTHGLDEVGRWVGAEPSGEAFNAISLEARTGRPANAMVNAGAIVTTALVPGSPDLPAFSRILTCLSRFAGRRLDVDEDVYGSEAETGDRNRALAYLIRSTGTLPLDPVAAVDTYFRQCSVRATAVDLAMMAGTLAHGGVNPLTGETVVSPEVAAQVLAVMATCGMYNASGDWLLRVGLPAKSGVSGGLIAAGPARFGLATYSPLLDAAGTSVRGQAALGALSERLGLHLMRNPALPGSTVTLVTTADVLPSAPSGRRERALHERVGVVAAQGALDFTAVERVLYALDESGPDRAGPVVLDLREVTGVDPVALALLHAGLARLARDGRRAAVVDPGDRLGPPDVVRERTGQDLPRFGSREEAVERCAQAVAGPVRAPTRWPRPTPGGR
ncbi:glutaminase A [Streptomyces sp. NBC_00059]|uniref:glutaminase A n=1 Tax=Streptomyces sp. NBC_00059 TaxID=2975635 RepID=UPI0022592ADE|nr:glutaminase A [Streptomyces sp. NBC_00059]MCX5414744.1 glutaminase A [Streptomyces sp. NBC_00059]